MSVFPDASIPTSELIQTRMNEVDNILQGAISGLVTFVSSLAAATVNDIPYIDAEQQIFTPAFIGVSGGHAPSDPDIQGELDAVPDANIDIDLDSVTIDDVDVPDFIENAPEINEPTVPSELSVTQPTEPVIEDIVVDSIPSISIPSIPTLQDVTWPEQIIISLPVFSGLLPDELTDMTILPFNYNDPSENYTTALLTAVNSKLLNDVTYGGTGLGETIENDIWLRQIERDEITLIDLIDDIIGIWSSRGCDLPNGILDAQISEQVEKFGWGRIDRSRDVAVKQAEIADSNTKFAVTSALQNEQMLIVHSDNVANRALEAAKATIEMGIAILKYKIDYYNSQLDRYKTEAQVYESQIRGEMLKAEINKNLLETTKLQVDIRKQYIDLYLAQIQAIDSQIKVYNTRLEQSKLKLSIGQQRVDIYKAEIEAFIALIRSKEMEYGLYKSKWDGELAKVSVFSKQVDAYSTQVGASKTKSDIIIARANTEIENNKYLLSIADMNLKKYDIDVRKSMSKVDALIRKYGADTDLFKGYVSISEAEGRLEMDRAKIIEQINASNVQTKLQAAIQNLHSFVAISNINVEAIKGGAQYYASLASAALQAISSSMSIASHYTGADSVSYTYSGSYGEPDEATTLPEPKSGLTEG